MGLFTDRIDNAHSRIGAILLVEDEPLVAFDNERALVRAGYHVVATVERYEHAVEVMAGSRVDLVVADVGLPGRCSGIDVAHHALTQNISVLFAAANCPPDAEQFALGWLAKPYASRDLVQAIRAVDRMMAGMMPRSLPDGMTLFERQD